VGTAYFGRALGPAVERRPSPRPSGTEFGGHVAEDKTTTITMLEGVVEASNDQAL
jgi:hypothetical protein